MPFHPFKALHKEAQLLLGDPNSDTAIVSCWTIKEKVAEYLADNGYGPSAYCAIGQLYSPTQGIDYLVRNLLANPAVKRLFVLGLDLTQSGEALADLFSTGFERGISKAGRPVWRIKSPIEAYVGPDISEDDLGILIETTQVVYLGKDWRGIDFLYELNRAPSVYVTREEVVYGEPPVEETKIYPSETSGVVVRGWTVAEAWLRALDVISRLGETVETHYDSPTKEILNLVSIIDGERPDGWYLPDYMGVSADELTSYCDGLTFPQAPNADLKYGYGELMTNYFKRPTGKLDERDWSPTFTPVNQLEEVAQKIAKEGEETKSAVVSLWDPTIHPFKGGSPCLNHLWFRERGGKLYLTAIIRSNDMYRAYPRNALGLRHVQRWVRNRIWQLRFQKAHDEGLARGDVAFTTQGLELGELTIVSESAHVYQDAWADIDALLSLSEVRHDLSKRKFDPRGNFVIGVLQEEELIKVTHVAPDGEVLQEWTHPGVGIIKEIAPFVSDVGHALYLGIELGKAAHCLMSETPYTQDR